MLEVHLGERHTKKPFKTLAETFRLTVRAWDSADAALQRKFTTAALEITINDVNDHAPVFNTPLRLVKKEFLEQ